MNRLFCILFLAGFSGSSLHGQSYSIVTVAGAERVVEGRPAVASPLRTPVAVTTDRSGNVYIADADDLRVRKVAPNGAISTYAGAGLDYFVGDGGPASSAGISFVTGLAADAAGNLYLADYGNSRVRKVSPSGTITTVVGTGDYFYWGDGGPATSAGVDPWGIAVDAQGNLYIADFSNCRIRKVDTAGVIRTIAGTGDCGYTGDGGPATSARIGEPTSVSVDPAGAVYFTDYFNSRIRKIDASGVVTTVAGNGDWNFSGDGGPATFAALDPYSITVDESGNILVADSFNHRIRKITAATGIITTVAGAGTLGFSGDGGPATSATLAWPASVHAAGGDLWIADEANQRVRKITPDGTIATIAGGAVGDGGPATNAFLGRPASVIVDAAGNLLIADTEQNRIRRVGASGVIETVAGTGSEGDGDGGGTATQAHLDEPAGIALDAAGNLYIADTDNYRVRKVTPGGAISRIAGSGTRGFAGDGGGAVGARLGDVMALAVDSANNVYLAEASNNRIRKVTPAGIISTIAGNGSRTAAGDGGPAITAQFHPYDIAFDKDGNLYIADRDNHRIRKIDTAGIITTVAGSGESGYSGDGGPATAARLRRPTGVHVDTAGNLYIADYDNLVVRRVTPAGIISTIAGNGQTAFSGDGGPALAAGLDPFRVTVDSGGRVYVADRFNDRVRKLTPQTPTQTAMVSGNNQVWYAAEDVPAPLVIRVLDGLGIPVAGLPVSFQVTSGSATVNPALTVTGPDGTAKTTVTLGSTAGPVTVTATAAGLPPLVFSLTANPARPKPRIFSGGVVGAALSVPQVKAVSPNGLVAVFGENFAPAGTLKIVDASDLVGGKIPTKLVGVCLLVNGNPAPVLGVTPTQVNFQTPLLASPATANIQVVPGCGGDAELRSNVEAVSVQAVAPEFFYFRYFPDGRNPIAAINALNGVRTGAPDLVPGVTFVPAKPGELLTLFLTGLGVTDPGFAPGELPDKAGHVRRAIQVTVGGVTLDPSDVLYTGVTPLNAGLYQLNIRVPQAVPDGDQAVVITVDGISSPAGGFITIRR